MRTNEDDDTVDMLLYIAVAPTTYERIAVQWSARDKYVIHVPNGHRLLLQNSVRSFRERQRVVNIMLTCLFHFVILTCR